MSSTRPTKAERIWRYRGMPGADVAAMLATAYEEFERTAAELAANVHEHTAECAHEIWPGCPARYAAGLADDIQELRAALTKNYPGADDAGVLASVDRPELFEASEELRTRAWNDAFYTPHKATKP